MFPAGGLLGILTATYTLSTYGGAVGWRYAFGIAGVTSLLILSLRFITPESKMWRSYIEQKRSGRLPPGYDVRSPLVQIFSKSVLRSTVFGTVLVIFYMFFFYAGNTFYPTFFSLVSPSVVSSILIIGTVSGIVGEWVVGYSGDVIGRRKAALIFGPLALLLIVPFFFYVTAQPKFVSLSTYPLFFAFVALNFPQSGFPALFGTWFSETFPTRMRSTASNFCYLIGRGLGGGLAPIAVPLWAGYFGKGPVALGSALSVAMLIGAIGMIAGAAGLRETRGTRLTPI
jgi:MFS family permease